MTPLARTGTVVTGYAGAAVLASLVVAIRVSLTNGPDALASSGMYAFGDAVMFVFVFGLAALVPTAAALYWLRSSALFWRLASSMALAVATIGVGAAVTYAVGRSRVAGFLSDAAAFSVLIMLVAPLMAAVFGLFAALCPIRLGRRLFLAATLAEAAVSLYAAVIWFLPMVLAR